MNEKVRSLIRLKNNWLKKRAVRLIIVTARQLGRDDANDMAGSIAYYSLLSIFPLLLGVFSILGFFISSEIIQRQIFQFLEANLPASVDLIERNVTQIVQLRGTFGIISLLSLFWTGSAVFSAIGRAMNRSWGVRKPRPFYIRKLRDISLGLAITILFFLSLGLTSFSSVILTIDISGMETMTHAVSRVLGFVTIFAVFILTYKFMPNVKTYWRFIWPGAFLAAVLFEIVRYLFIYYLGKFASYELVYGSVASIIVLMVWIYLSAYTVVIGAEFSSAYSRMYGKKGRNGP